MLLSIAALSLPIYIPIGISISPSIAKIPITIKPTPALLATHIPPCNHIFSPNIIAANKAIHSKFIQPKAIISRK
jgi:hypothetical protein